MGNDQFWNLLKQEHAKAEAFCRKLTGSRDEGDDLYHEGLLAAMRRFDRLRDHNSFRPWLYRILVNRFKNRNRSPWYRRREALNDDILGSRSGRDPSLQHAARRWLSRAFRALNPDEKALVVLFEVEGWQVAELAEMLGRPEGTIKARLSRARWKMRDEIARYLSAHELRQLEKGPLCVVTKRNTD
jgi:RNA polymerase sigma-70 factor (ECF subfamily)